MARFYYLGPWVLDDKGSFPVWRGPVGTIGAVDLRGSGSGAGIGFFTTAEEIAEPGYTAFGSANGERLDSLTMNAEQRAKWGSTLGVAESPDGATLLDLLWNALTIHSDPDGVTGPKPIMPTSRGVFELHLGGHSLVRSARLPRNPDAIPHWGKVQRVLQSVFREVADVAARGETQKKRDLHKRWLGFQQQKYGLTAEAATALIVPEDMPRTTPLKPETTITDDFNRADQGGLGTTTEGWSWVLQTGGTSDWAIVGNKGEYSGSAETPATARANSSLSGDDHYATVTINHTGGGASLQDLGVMARKVTGNDNGYAATYYALVGNIRLWKQNGSATVLGAVSVGTGLTNVVLTCEADGSTIRALHGGVEIISVTDTSLTGQLQTGLWSWNGGDGSFESFEAADLGGTPSTITLLTSDGKLIISNGQLVYTLI